MKRNKFHLLQILNYQLRRGGFRERTKHSHGLEQSIVGSVCWTHEPPRTPVDSAWFKSDLRVLVYLKIDTTQVRYASEVSESAQFLRNPVLSTPLLLE